MSKLAKVIVALVLLILLIGSFLSKSHSPYGIGLNESPSNLYMLVVKNKDLSICEKIHPTYLSDSDITPGLISECYANYAQAYPQENVCQIYLANHPDNTFDGTSYYQNFTSCIDKEAIGASDVNICSQINRSNYEGFKIACVKGLANSKKNPTLCKTLSKPTDQEDCLNHIQTK